MAATTSPRSINTVAPTLQTSPVVVRVGANSAAAAALFADKSIPAADGRQQTSASAPSEQPQQQLHFSTAVFDSSADFDRSSSSGDATSKSTGLSPEARNILRQIEEQRAVGPYTCLFGQPDEEGAEKDKETEAVPESMIAQFNTAINGCPQDSRKKKATKKKKKTKSRGDKSKKKYKSGDSSESDAEEDEEATAAPTIEETETVAIGAKKSRHRKSRGGRAIVSDAPTINPKLAADTLWELMRRFASCLPQQQQQQFPAIQWQPNQLPFSTPAEFPGAQFPATSPLAMQQQQVQDSAPTEQPQNSDSMTVPRGEWAGMCNCLEQMRQQNADLSEQLKVAQEQRQDSANQIPPGDLLAAARRIIEITREHNGEFEIDHKVYAVHRRNKKVDGKRKRGRPSETEAADAEKARPSRKKRAVGGVAPGRTTQAPALVPGNVQTAFAPIVDPNNPDAPVQVLGMPGPIQQQALPQQQQQLQYANGATEMTYVEAAGQMNYDQYMPPQPLPATPPTGLPEPNFSELFGGGGSSILPPSLGDNLDFPQS